jgi:hypothetical protein
VLEHLADHVGTIADSAEAEAGLTASLASAYGSYVRAARALLTGSDVPQGNPGGPPPDASPITLSRPDAVTAVNALGEHVGDMLGKVADVGAEHGKTVNEITKKEAEEKQGGKPPDGKKKDGGEQPPGGQPGGDTKGKTTDGPQPVPPVAPGPDTGSGGSGGTTTGSGPPASGAVSGPTAPTGGAGGGATPPTKEKPEPKPQPKPEPKLPTGRPKVTPRPTVTRRCFRFHITNVDEPPITDLHFQQPGLTASGMTGPDGWSTHPIRTADGAPHGFCWKAPAGKALRPGQVSKDFTFCLEDAQFGGDVLYTHADPQANPPTKVPPGNIRAKGGAVGVNADGSLAMPVDKTTYVHNWNVDVVPGTAPNFALKFDGLAAGDRPTFVTPGMDVEGKPGGQFDLTHQVGGKPAPFTDATFTISVETANPNVSLAAGK